MLLQDTSEEDSVKVKRNKLSSTEDGGLLNGTDETLPDPNTEHKKAGKFSKFHISKVTRGKLKERNIRFLFPIQYKTFDYVYDGCDVIGQARTGTGKTLAFVLPLLEKLSAVGNLSNKHGRPPTVLTMAPTRELANQVKKNFYFNN